MDQEDHPVREERVQENVEVRRQGGVAQRVQDGGNEAPVSEERLRLKCGQRDVVAFLAAVGEFRRDSPARALQRHDRIVSHQNIPRARPPSTVIVVPVT